MSAGFVVPYLCVGIGLPGLHPFEVMAGAGSSPPEAREHGAPEKGYVHTESPLGGTTGSTERVFCDTYPGNDYDGDDDEEAQRVLPRKGRCTSFVRCLWRPNRGVESSRRVQDLGLWQ